jgi:hypothetical protein
MELTQEQLAYIAGFIEGDGCFFISRYFSKQSGYVYEYRLAAYNTNEKIMLWFKENVGGWYRQVNTSSRWKKPFHWALKNQEAIVLVELIFPYLVAKKEEAKIWLKYAKNIIPNKTNKRTQKTIDYRVNLIDEIREVRKSKNIVKKEDCNKYGSIVPKTKPSQVDFAYLAGLSDAEGCFRVHRHIKINKPNKVYATSLEIGNTNSLFFPWLISRFNGYVHFNKGKDLTKKTAATWCIMAAQLRSILNNLIKYLIIKHPVCEKVIEFDNTIIKNGGDRHSKQFKESYKSVLVKREDIFAQIQVLNTKGRH